MLKFSVLYLILINSAFAKIDVFLFKEKDGASSVLYRATCVDGKPNYCSLFAMTISPETSPRKCMITAESLFQNEVSIKSSKDTWTVTLSKGICGYTNTYTFSATGMVQVKTSPAKAVGTMCEVFSPKIYKAEHLDNFFFPNISVGNCKEMSVSTSGL